jgi:hypothetical protein
MTCNTGAAGPTDHGELPAMKPGERSLTRVTTAQTQQACPIVEMVPHPGDSAPMRVHQNEDEREVILKGMARIVHCNAFDATTGAAITPPALAIAGLFGYVCRLERTTGESFDRSRRGASVAEGFFETTDHSPPGAAVQPARRPITGSSLVQSLVRATGDPAKRRIRAWLGAIDDKRFVGLGLTSEDIAALRGAANPSGEATIAQGLGAPSEDRGTSRISPPIAGCDR